jgi:phage tail sheath gpL-like
MGDKLSKLRPDRDLQCYFFEPSAIAALSETSPSGFTISGCWRSQSDWAVLEWNRDNVFEYPSLRSLPDGDLSGLQLSYQEVRANCIGIDSTWYPTQPWPHLRIWAEAGGVELIYEVPLLQYSTPLSNAVPATVQLQLQGSASTGDYIELAWLDQHYNYQLVSGDTLTSAAAALADAITANQQTGLVSATADGSTITLTYLGVSGSNGNRLGVYGTVHGAGTESWKTPFGLFQGGVSPAGWQVNLDFANLKDLNGVSIPVENMTNVRKLRWTWAADVQAASFERSEFSITVSDWTVAGTGSQYQVAAPGSRRIENDSTALTYTGSWALEIGNYSGGSIQSTITPGSAVACSYTTAVAHALYLGTRTLTNGGQVTVQVDGGAPIVISLAIAGEDVLMRIPLGQQAASVAHIVTITNSGIRITRSRSRPNEQRG